MDHLDDIYDAIIDGDKNGTVESVKAALADGLSPKEILNDGMIAAMDEVGRLFEETEIFVPEMLVAARAMKAGLELLRPYLVKSGIEPAGKVVLGTVQGDMHDIGKNLVGMMLEGAGFEIVDLGVDVAPEKFIEALQGEVDILGMSALLTTTMVSMEKTVKAIEAAGLRHKAKIMVGGAPVTE
ncbi:MAG: corrinoid protein, partial [Anaerolineae bacterium]|nr:corrinoid protein [Anaerolineae bacterium]